MSERGKSEKCRTCLHGFPTCYVDKGERVWACVYADDMKRRRGCPGGDECTKWEPNLRAVAKHLLRLPPEKTIFGKFYKER